METIKRFDAKNIGEWLASASVEEVSKEKRLTLLKACWKIQDYGEETDAHRTDIVERFAIDGIIPEDKKGEATSLILEMMREELPLDVALDEDTLDAFILSNPKWTAGQCRAIRKTLS